MGLGVGDDFVDVSEDADLSGGGDDGRGLCGGGARLLVCYRFPRICGEFWEDFSGKSSFFFSISAVMCFWSVGKGEVVNVVEVLTDKCIELWECLRFDPYSNDC